MPRIKRPKLLKMTFSMIDFIINYAVQIFYCMHSLLLESRLLQKNDSLATTLQFPNISLSSEGSYSDEDQINHFLLLQRNFNFLHRQREENRFLIDLRAKKVKELRKEVEATKDRIVERKTLIMKNKEKMERMRRKDATQSARIDRKINSLRKETRELYSQIREKTLARKAFPKKYQPFYAMQYLAPPEFYLRPPNFHQQQLPGSEPNQQLRRGNLFLNPQLRKTQHNHQKKNLKERILDPIDLEKAELIQAANLMEKDIIESQKNSLKNSTNYKIKISSNPTPREVRSSQNRSSLNSSQSGEEDLIRQSSKTWQKDQEDEILLERIKGKIITEESYDLPQKSKSQMNSNDKSSINVVYQNSQEKKHHSSSEQKDSRPAYSPLLSPNMIRSKGMKQSKIEINVLQSLVDEFELNEVRKKIQFTQEMDFGSSACKQIMRSQLQIKEVMCFSQKGQDMAAPPSLKRDNQLRESVGIKKQKAEPSLQESITLFCKQPLKNFEAPINTPSKLLQSVNFNDDDEFLSSINLQPVSKISRGKSTQEKQDEKQDQDDQDQDDADEAAEMLRQSQEKPSTFMKKGSGVKTANINRSPSLLASELSPCIDEEEDEDDSDVQKIK